MARERRYSIDLGAHIAECDANYARLRALAPSICAPPEPREAQVAGAVNGGARRDPAGLATEDFAVELLGTEARVLVRLLERSRYTSLIQFTQGGAGAAGAFAAPSMVIRLYHDTQSAEVVEVHDQRRFREAYQYPNPRMRSRDEKAQINRFLGEYLAMCLRFGLASPARLAIGSS